MIAIDANVVIYAGLVPRVSDTPPAELEVRLKLLLHMQKKETILLPTVAVAEVLVPVSAAQRGPLLAALSARFVCQSFNLPAAAIAAELWSQHKNLPPDLQYEDRHVLRADAMIVATAKSAGANEFYSHDRRCRALADLVMTGCDLPERDPNDIFLVDDIRRDEV